MKQMIRPNVCTERSAVCSVLIRVEIHWSRFVRHVVRIAKQVALVICMHRWKRGWVHAEQQSSRLPLPHERAPLSSPRLAAGTSLARARSSCSSSSRRRYSFWAATTSPLLAQPAYLSNSSLHAELSAARYGTTWRDCALVQREEAVAPLEPIQQILAKVPESCRRR